MLDLALNTDAQGEDAMFREDVKVTMASSGLYDWLLKVVNESGDLGGGEEGEGGMDGHAHTGPQSHGSHRDRKSTRLNSSHSGESRMPSSA